MTVTPSGVTLTTDLGDDVAWVCQPRGCASRVGVPATLITEQASLLIAVTDPDKLVLMGQQ